MGLYTRYIDDIITKIKSGETVDAFFVRNDYGIKKLVDEGLVKDLSNLLKDYGDKLSRNYKGSDLAAYTYNGILAMLPNLMP